MSINNVKQYNLRTFNPLVTSSNLVRPTTQFSQLASNPLLEKAAGFVF